MQDTLGFTRMFGRMNAQQAAEYVEKLNEAMCELQRHGQAELAKAIYFAAETARGDSELLYVEHAQFERVR